MQPALLTTKSYKNGFRSALKNPFQPHAQHPGSADNLIRLMTKQRLPHAHLLLVAQFAAIPTEDLNLFIDQIRLACNAKDQYTNRMRAYRAASSEVTTLLDAILDLMESIKSGLHANPLTMSEATYRRSMPRHPLARAMVPMPILALYDLFANTDSTLPEQGYQVLYTAQKELSRHKMQCLVESVEDSHTLKFIYGLINDTKQKMRTNIILCASVLSTC